MPKLDIGQIVDMLMSLELDLRQSMNTLLYFWPADLKYWEHQHTSLSGNVRLLVNIVLVVRFCIQVLSLNL